MVVCGRMWASVCMWVYVCVCVCGHMWAYVGICGRGRVATAQGCVLLIRVHLLGSLAVHDS